MSDSAVLEQRPSAVTEEAPRARQPDETGYVERGGVRTYYEVHGTREPTILLLPPWTIFHSRVWKAQVPYLARHFRVVVFDGRGGGMSDRPQSLEAYAIEEIARDAVAVMDATVTDRACVVALSRGAQFALSLANDNPERVQAIAFIGAGFPASWRSLHVRLMSNPRVARFLSRRLPRYPGWMKFNPNYLVNEYQGFLRWWVSRVANDPHSTMINESSIEYASESSGPVAFASIAAPSFRTRPELLARARALRCPVLVIHGERDRATPLADGKLLARVTGAKLMRIQGAGHVPHARYPVVVNLALRRFFTEATGR